MLFVPVYLVTKMQFTKVAELVEYKGMDDRCVEHFNRGKVSSEQARQLEETWLVILCPERYVQSQVLEIWRREVGQQRMLSDVQHAVETQFLDAR